MRGGNKDRNNYRFLFKVKEGESKDAGYLTWTITIHTKPTAGKARYCASKSGADSLVISLDAGLCWFLNFFSASISNQLYFEKNNYKWALWTGWVTPVIWALRRQEGSWNFVTSLSYIRRYYLKKQTATKEERINKVSVLTKARGAIPQMIDPGEMGDQVTDLRACDEAYLVTLPEGPPPTHTPL